MILFKELALNVIEAIVGGVVGFIVIVALLVDEPILKAFEPIVVTFAGIVNSVNALQLLNVFTPIFVILSGILIDVNEEQ